MKARKLMDFEFVIFILTKEAMVAIVGHTTYRDVWVAHEHVLLNLLVHLKAFVIS